MPDDLDLDVQATLPVLGVALSLALLPCQRPHLGLHLRDDVLEPLEIHLGPFESSRGSLAPILVLPDPGGLLEEPTTLLVTIGKNRVHHALLDHGVRVRT